MMSLSGESSKNILETYNNTEHSDTALKSDKVTVKIDFILVIILTEQNYTILDLTLWPWSWTFTVQHTIYVKYE